MPWKVGNGNDTVELPYTHFCFYKTFHIMACKGADITFNPAFIIVINISVKYLVGQSDGLLSISSTNLS